MTPAARAQAAIDILDQVLDGRPAEQALTGWARKSRFAGSKDRAAVRDLVFDVLRSRRSLAAISGQQTGRGLVLGLFRRDGPDPETIFTGAGYAPAELSTEERYDGRAPADPAERADIPDWLWPRFSKHLGDTADAVGEILKRRAPIHLRVNLRKGDRAQAIESLGQDGIVATLHSASQSALVVVEGARKIRNSSAYRSGLVELQDAASQAVVDAIPLRDGQRVLDYCAGGGGKSLAIAARADVTVFAHDAAPQRMSDLPDRAARAGVSIPQISGQALSKAAPFDVVLTDVPCSGSGAWRRAPEGKWRLTQEQFDRLLTTQAEILNQTAAMVAPGGVLAYATCSLLEDENDRQIDAFLARYPDWCCVWRKNWSVLDGTDGFFAAHLTRKT